MVENVHGGPWTQEKLIRLRKYLEAYMTIFKKNERAVHFRTTYADAFAGSGAWKPRFNQDRVDGKPLFDDFQARNYLSGSVQLALEIDQPFDEYLFIDRDPEYAEQLSALSSIHPSRNIVVVAGDANVKLIDWCQRTDWKKNRAVAFLDPYGMQVEWATLEALARTEAVDLWLLFPLGMGVNRLLKNAEPPRGAWAKRLTLFFGTDDWVSEFYKPSMQMSLFDEEQPLKKEATLNSIASYFLGRLQSIFAGVADRPLYLRNSRNFPIFLLCFAAANKKGAKTAVKIAQHLLKE